MKKNKIIILITLLAPIILINTSNLVIFPGNKTYQDDNSNIFEDTVNLETSSSDCNPVKFEWVKYWSSSGDNDLCFGSFMDSDDNIYLTGYQNFGNGDLHLVLVKYDKDGNFLFSSNWGIIGNDQHTGYDLVLDSMGNIYCAGIWRKDHDDWNEDFILIKFDSFGNHIWSRQWGGSGKEKCYAVACDSQDNLYLTGYTSDYEGEVVTLKYNSSGNLIWTRYWGGSYHESGFDLTIDSSDNIYVAGYTYTTYASNDMVIIKYDSDGNKLLNFTWGTPNVDYGRALAFDSKNNLYLAGQADYNVCLIKYNSTLDYQWNTTIGGSGDPRCIAFDSNDDIYLGGYTTSFGAYSSDFYLLKFDSSGNFHYRQLRNQEIDYAYAVHIDSNDDIYLTGSNYYDFSAYSRMMMIKYTEPPCIAVISPEPYSIYNNTAPGFNISIYEPHLDTSWYSLNNGHNYTFTGNIGTINQIAWELCEDGTIILRFFANDSIGKRGTNLIYLWKDSQYPDSATPDLSYLICWDDNGVPISTEEHRQFNVRICSDGKGGAIMAWQDERRRWEQDIYVQKVNVTGDVQWTIDGLIICSMTNGDTAYDVEICPDGKGGAIVTWKDNRDSRMGIFIQKVDSDGNVEWIQNGVTIISIASGLGDPYICSDSRGGAFITWKLSSDNRIYAQHINSKGILQWGSNGILISSANVDTQFGMFRDKNGGFVIGWRTTGGNIYAQKISSTGSKLWGSNGVPISETPENKLHPKMCYDGIGGAIITWSDYKELEGNIYAQRVNSTGSLKWKIDGSPICTTQGIQNNPQILNDGNQGVIIIWEDSRNGNTDIYGQRVNVNGEMLWVIDGFPICNALGTQNQVQVCSDGENGAFVTWTDSRNGNADVYAQRIGSIGYGLWESNGVSICNETGNQDWVQICNYSNNGAIIVWQDTRSSGSYDLYTQKIRKDKPEIFINDPMPYQLCGKNAPDFDLYIEEYNINQTWYSLNDGKNYTFTGNSGKINQEAWDICGNGTASITFYVNNSNGLLGKRHLIVRKDIIDPNITIISPNAYDLFGNSTINFEISIDESNLNSTWYVLNGGPSYHFTGLTGTINQEAWDTCGNGTVSIRFYANDSVGNWAFEEVVVHKDTHFPILVVYSPVEYQICGLLTIDFELYFYDPILNNTWYTINGSSAYYFNTSSGTINQQAWDACGNGTVSIIFYANNTVGNLVMEEVIVRKNIYSPYIDITSPLPNQLFGNVTFDFEVYIYDPFLDATWYTLNDGSPVSFIGLIGTINQAAWNDCGNGLVSIKFYANNTGGNWAFEEVVVHKDNIHPNITILSPIQYEFFGNNSPSFEVSLIEPHLNSTWYTLNGGTSYPFTGLGGVINQSAWNECGNGTVSIIFYANDSVGNWAYKEIIIRKDIYDPLMTINSPTSLQLFGNNSINFELIISEANLDKSWYNLNGSSYSFFTGATGTINPLLWDTFGNGIILIKFYANDSAGNLVVTNVSVEKDVKVPDILILNPITNEFYSDSTPNFTVFIKDKFLHSMWYTLNNGEKIPFLSNITISQTKWDLTVDGNALLTFFANDSMGNLNSAFVTIIKDTTIPVLTINQPQNNDLFGIIAPNFNIKASEIHLNTIMYSLDGGYSYQRIFANGSFDQNEWDKLPNGTVTIVFYANDSAGNEAYQFVNVFVKKYIPTLKINSPANNEIFGVESPIFNVWVNNSDDALWYSYDNGTTIIMFTDNGTLSGWDSLYDGFITITFFANDTAGNWYSTYVTIKKDTEEPIITILSPVITNFNTESPSCVLEITDSSNIIAMWCSINDGLHNFNITELAFKVNQSAWDSLSEGEVTLTFYAMDEVGNIGSREIVLLKEQPSSPTNPVIHSYPVYLIFGIISILTYLLTRKVITSNKKLKKNSDKR